MQVTEAQTQITVLYEDAALVVCVKPRGVLAAADASGKRSMAELLAPRTVYPVHRLDRETVGLMAFAKTREAAAALSAQLDEGFCKEYLAQCETPPAPPEGTAACVRRGFPTVLWMADWCSSGCTRGGRTRSVCSLPRVAGRSAATGNTAQRPAARSACGRTA